MNQESVILIHGMARTYRSMNKIEKALQAEGYHVVNLSYPSTTFPIKELADKYIPQALSQCPQSSKIHFVTHSLGGILLRQYLSENAIEKLGNTVMLAPPNKGSQLTDKLKHIFLYRWINGPAGMDLGTDANSAPARLGHINFPVGVIAGRRSVNLLLSLLLPSPDDGKVSVENTKIEGMQDHITLPTTHTFLMQNRRVIKQIKHFLLKGKFAVAND